MAEERLQKIVAAAGLASRRGAEELISAGRVRVDGRVVTELGFKADPRRSKIEVDGQRLVAERPVYLVLHKPRGVVSTMHDPEGRPTVAELVRRAPGRVVPVGRLDYHTSGVLLMTNDGEFANALLHPKKSTQKIYVAKVQGEVSDVDLERWRQPIEIEGKRTRPAKVRRLRWEQGKTWLEIELLEGRNRQIHRLGEAAGFPVMRLARLSFAGITAEGLRPGEWRALTARELVELKRVYGVPRRVSAQALPEESRGGALVSGRRGQGGPGRRASASPSGGRLPRGSESSRDTWVEAAAGKSSRARAAERTGTARAGAGAPKRTGGAAGRPSGVPKRGAAGSRAGSGAAPRQAPARPSRRGK
ncbi:MAG: rRNA pseudouridine synthase [Polyangiaceae bacterium]|nr:rRNA pseudouridine synthase [Polyangiaceae bacterium]MCW5790848.1 rRNA pseudouridine synthase [Polyangiaceae bacterium]